MPDQTLRPRCLDRCQTVSGPVTRTLSILAFAAIVAASSPGLAERPPATTPPKPQAAPDRTAPEPPKRQLKAQPLCRDVGGYSAYLRRTGKICRLSGEEFNNPGYRGFR